MLYNAFREQFKDFLIFSPQDIRKRDPEFHRQRMHEWMKKGYIQKVAKGWYIFSDLSVEERMLFLTANVLYAPSYVSLESALSYYGLIPEGVYAVISVSSRTTRSFKSDLASFQYQHIKPNLMWGYGLVGVQNRFFKIAEPEKAILDYLYLHTHIKTRDDFLGLRINGDSFREKIDIAKLIRYAENFGYITLRKRIDVLLQVI